jgi:hypothetical protein
LISCCIGLHFVSWSRLERSLKAGAGVSGCNKISFFPVASGCRPAIHSSPSGEWLPTTPHYHEGAGVLAVGLAVAPCLQEDPGRPGLVIDIGFIGLRPTRAPKSGRGSGRKVMKPFSELNPKVWQSDCLVCIDQQRSEMFRSCRAGGLVLGAATFTALIIPHGARCPRRPGFRRERTAYTVVAQSP